VGLGASLSLGSLCLVAELLSVGVAPFSVLGLDEAQADALRQAAVERIASHRSGRQAVPPADVDAAVAALRLAGDELRTCLQDGPCASRVAQRARADRLLVGSAAGLGRTYVLRLNLVDASRSAVSQEVQQTVEGDFDDLSAALVEQVDLLLGPTPWYRRWWVWTLVVGAVVAAAVVTTVVLLLPGEQPIDPYPLP
jgi:hypothetical protein